MSSPKKRPLKHAHKLVRRPLPISVAAPDFASFFCRRVAAARPPARGAPHQGSPAAPTAAPPAHLPHAAPTPQGLKKQAVAEGSTSPADVDAAATMAGLLTTRSPLQKLLKAAPAPLVIPMLTSTSSPPGDSPGSAAGTPALPSTGARGATRLSEPAAAAAPPATAPRRGGNISGAPKNASASWNATQDEALKKLVVEHNAKNWKQIAEGLPGKTPTQCLHRWQRVLNPDVVKGPWKATEDERLRELVEKIGSKHWSRIAQEMQGRNGKQCRERWINHLKPDISKEPWSKVEEDILISAHASMGSKWSEMEKLLKGRTENAIKNHWHSTLRKRKEQTAEAEAKAAAAPPLAGGGGAAAIGPPPPIAAAGASPKRRRAGGEEVEEAESAPPKKGSAAAIAATIAATTAAIAAEHALSVAGQAAAKEPTPPTTEPPAAVVTAAGGPLVG